jgi:glycosyltransferase involved in cell wall biosynthesis
MGKPGLAYVIPQYPPLGGYRNRFLSQLQMFSSHFDIHLVSLSADPEFPDLSAYVSRHINFPPSTPGHARRWADALTALIQDGRPISHGFHPLSEQRKNVGRYLSKNGVPLLWASGTLAGLISKDIPAEFRFLDFCDSNYVSSCSSGMSWFARETNKRFEKRLARHFDGFAYISRRDGASLGYRESEFIFLPNLRSLQPPVTQAKSCDLVLVGNWAYPPNRDGLSYFLGEVLPLLQESVHVTVLGPGIGGLPRAGSHKINCPGFVPELPQYIRASKLMLAPIRLGSGAQQKVFDGLEAGIPVLATPFVCKGADPDRSCPAIIECSSPADFVREISHLLEDEPERGRLGLEGRKWLESMAADSLSAHQELVARMVAASSGSPRRLSR